MGVPVAFTGNVVDLCNANGFQWEFRCNRCGNGFESPFQQNIAARGKGVLRTAGQWFGGSLERFSEGLDEFNEYGFGGGQSATKDRAFARAVERVKPNFRQCRGCGVWVCATFCWNDDVGQCQQCSPLAREEIARAQADAQWQQLRDQAAQQDWTGGLDVEDRPTLRCNTCGGYNAGGKFCQQCGQPLQIAVRCQACGTTAAPGAMFCGNCGAQL